MKRLLKQNLARFGRLAIKIGAVPVLLRMIQLLADAACVVPVATAAEWRLRPDTHVIRFAGYDWLVKDSAGTAVGPGPNVFSADNVRVEVGRLHLRIGQQGRRWSSAEIVSKEPFGYGMYTFFIQGDVADLDPNVVLGLFTWSDDPAFSHREIDIEISRWGNPANRNAQCVVQPYQLPGSVVRFALPGGLKRAIYTFTWLPNAVTCKIAGVVARPDRDVTRFQFKHQFTEHIPVPDGQNARINLWQLGGQPPTRNKAQAVVIAGFTFTPFRKQGPTRR
jgi:hypothetical protein